MNNQPLTKINHADSYLRLHSIFYTIQGEGPFAGCPALFVRLQGCNLRCHWCDTEYSVMKDEYTAEHLHDIVMEEIKKNFRNASLSLVVLTGGEPLAQNVAPFIKMLLDNGVTVQVETNGTTCPPDLPWDRHGLHVVVSPKTGTVDKEFNRHKVCWKYVLKAGHTNGTDGLPTVSTQVANKIMAIARPPGNTLLENVYVSPCDDETFEENMAEVVRVALKYGYKVSLQTHKILGVE